MIKVFSTVNDGLILDVLGVPAIWEAVSDGETKLKDYPIDHENSVWLMMTVNNVVVAMYNFEALNSVSIKIHAHVLPEYRKQYSRQTGKEALRWIKSQATWVHKIIAEVPMLHPNVANFVLSLGFKEEGINRESYLKNELIYDQWLFGITVEEIEGVLNVQNN